MRARPVRFSSPERPVRVLICVDVDPAVFDLNVPIL